MDPKNRGRNPMIPATESERKRPPVGAERRWAWKQRKRQTFNNILPLP